MTTDLNLRCACGRLRGRLRGAGPSRGQRMRCYCRDCQSYAHHLGQADRVLDAQGGTILYQTTWEGLEFTRGENQLACLRLSPKGPLRWFTRCCNTPVANTLPNASLPFVALPRACWTRDPGEQLGREIGIFARDAQGDRAQLKSFDRPPTRVMLRVLARLIKGRLRGVHRRSPFFDPDSGQPRCEPTILSREQRAKALAEAGFA